VNLSHLSGVPILVEGKYYHYPTFKNDITVENLAFLSIPTSTLLGSQQQEGNVEREKVGPLI
jgi:hypothetical protein